MQEVDTPPAPTADRVRVRVHAAGLNRADILQRRGHYPAPPGYPPNIPGMEFAGEVESIGDAVRTWEIGDRVFGITGGGAQAEFVVAPESNLARIQPELDWVEASGLGRVYSTTVIRQKPPAPSYNLALIDLAEGPRMMSNIVDCPQTPEALVLDMPLEVAFEKIDDEITLPLFRPAKG